MKKKLFSKFASVLLAVVMTIGMGAVTFGAKEEHLITPYHARYENSYYETIVEIKGSDVDIKLQEISDDGIKGDFYHIEAKNGVSIEDGWGGEKLDFSKKNNKNAIIFVNGKNVTETLPDDYDCVFSGCYDDYDKDGSGDIFMKNMYNNEIHIPEIYGNSVDLILTEIYEMYPPEETPTPETQTLSATFAGSTTTQYGDYGVAVAGSLTGEFQEGENVLTKEQINEQTMYVVIRNKANGEVVARKQNSASVKDTTVTVSNGQVVSVTVGGQANTANGRKDNYSVTMLVQ